VYKGRHQIHCTVGDVERTARTVGLRREILIVLSIHVKLVLYKAGEMGAHDAGFVGGISRSVISNDRVFTQGDANSCNLHL
jgi:hypothetical protein